MRRPYKHVTVSVCVVLMCVLPLTTAFTFNAGMASNCVIASGQVHCWGLNEEGLVPTGNTEPSGNKAGDMAILPSVPFTDTHAIVQVSVGEQQACVVFFHREVKCWGLNDGYQLGTGTTTSVGLTTADFAKISPLSFKNMQGARIMQVSMGQAHACSLTWSGEIRCWGSGADGRLGHDAVTDIQDPKDAAALVFGSADAAVQISAGNRHTCALFKTNFMRCWGLGGRLGDQTTTNAGDGGGTALAAITAIPWASSTPVQMDAADHTCVLFASKIVRCFGAHGGDGRLGYNTAANVGDAGGGISTAVQTQLGFVPADNPAAVYVGEGHSCAVFDNGKVKCWGSNSHGQLGISNTNNVGTAGNPLNVGGAYVAFPGGVADEDVIALSLGADHTCALHNKATLTVRCWGAGYHGQLGKDSVANIGDSALRPVSANAAISFPGTPAKPLQYDIFPGTSDSVGGGTFRLRGPFSTMFTWFALGATVHVKFDNGAGQLASTSGTLFVANDLIEGTFPPYGMAALQTTTAVVYVGPDGATWTNTGTSVMMQVVPTIVAIGPLGGQIGGGTVVTVEMDNPLDYRDVHTCDFGGTVVQGHYSGGNNITCDPAPATAAGGAVLTIRPGTALSVPATSTFTFSDIVMQSVTPSLGRIGGGTLLTVEATNIADVGVGVVCVFRKAPIQIPTPAVINGGGATVNCTTPDLSAFDAQFPLPITVDVHLSNDGGQSLSANSVPFKLHSDISVEELDPDGVPLNEIATITVKGRGFFNSSIIVVRFQIGNQISFLNGTYDDATGNLLTPTAAASLTGVGVFDVSFNGVDFTKDAVPFSYYEIYKSWPVGGSIAGGTTVTVIGAGFRPSGEDLKCQFNQTDVVATYQSSSKITCLTPETNYTGTSNVNVTVNGRQYVTGNETIFTYHGVPLFTSLSDTLLPSKSNLSSTVALVVNGANLVDLGTRPTGIPGPTCSLGTVAGTPIVDADSSTFTCIVPRTTGRHQVKLSLNNQKTYETGLYLQFFDLFKLETVTGPSSGGTDVLIYGSGFATSGTPKCRFGTVEVPATPLSIVEARCVSPPAVPGVQKVEYSPSGSMWTLNGNDFTFYDTPRVVSVSPISGPGSGGTKVTISGQSFLSGGQVSCRFGLATSTGVMVNGKIECVSPVGYGEVDLEVSFNAGLSWTANQVKFYFTVIGAIDPPIGPVSGGTPVRLIGVGFNRVLDPNTYCKFGTTSGIKSTYIDDLTVQCVSPPRSSPLAEEVTVTSNSGGYGAKGPQFEYYPDPLSTSFIPTHGSKNGGTTVTVIGVNFKNTRRIKAKFGDTIAPLAEYVTPSLIYVTTPPGTGASSLAVSLNGADYFSVGIFNFFTLLDISPRNGPVPGGTTVSVSGSGFGGAKSVRCKLGENVMIGTLVHPGLVTCTVPPAASLNEARKPLLVSANGGQEYTEASGVEGQFSYYSPVTVTAISPSTGSSAGGTVVTIYGSNILDQETLACKMGDEFDTPFVLAEYINGSIATCVTPPHLPGKIRPALSINSQQAHQSTEFLFEFKDCPVGTFARVHSDPCTPCPPGEFSNIVGAKECQSCNQESYAPQNGTFQCEPCPDNTLIEDLLRTNETQCVCAPGFYNQQLSGGIACDPCPEGAECPGGTDAPLPLANWWNDPSDRFAFLECENTEQCPGGVEAACAQGYKGRLCALCEKDYFARGSYCQRCPEQSYWILVAFCIFLLASMGILVKLVGKSASAFGGTINIAFYFFQVLSIMKNIDLQWPKSIDGTLNIITSPFTLDLDILASECSIPLVNYHVKWVGMLILPVLFAFAFYMLMLVAKAKAASSSDPDAQEQFQSTKNVLGDGFLLFMALMYLVLVQTSLEHFDCTKLADGQWTLDAQPDLICYNKLWWTMTPIALSAALLYGLATPLFFLWLINKHKDHLARAETVEMMGSIYIEYKPSRAYWEVVVMFEKAAISICLTYFTVHPDLQILSFLLILMAGLAANMLMEPFFVHRYNKLQNALRWCSCVMLLAGMLFRAAKFPNEGARLFVIALVFLTIASGILLVAGIVLYDIYVIRRALKRNMEDNTYDYLAELAHPQGKTAVLEWLAARPADSPDNIRYIVETLYRTHKYVREHDDSEMLRQTREVSVTDVVLNEFCSKVFYEEAVQSIRHWMYVQIELAKKGDDRAMADIRRFHGIFADLGNYVRFMDATDTYDGIDAPLPRLVTLDGRELHIKGLGLGDDDEDLMMLEMDELPLNSGKGAMPYDAGDSDDGMNLNASVADGIEPEIDIMDSDDELGDSK